MTSSETTSIPFHFPLYYSIPFLSTFSAVSAVSLAPTRSMPACSHQHILTRFPCFLSVALQRSRSDSVEMYCTTILYLFWMYVSIVSNPASSLAASDKIYSHFLYSCHRGSRSVSYRATWSLNPPRTYPMWGLTTHISAPKSITDYMMALKKSPDTRGLAPSLIRIPIILLHTSHAFVIFRITAV